MGVAMGKMPDGTSPNYSELQLDASKYLKVAVQGTVSLAATPTIDIGDVQLKDVAGAQVNPATSDLQTTGNAVLVTMDADTGSIKTNTDTLVASGGGGYVRQDSTATIAKEAGGNLATVKTNTDPLVASGGGGYVRQDSTATIAKESGGNLATIAGDTTNIEKCIMGAAAPTIDSYTSDDFTAAANTADQSLVAAPGANKQIWVYGMLCKAGTAAGSISIQDEDNTALSGVMSFADKDGFVIPVSGNFAMPWIKVATNKALEMDTVTASAAGIITYAIVSV